MFLVVLHDPLLHLGVLVGHEFVAGQVRVVGIVLGHEVPAFGLDDVAGHQGGGVVVALHQALGEVPFDLEAEEVPRVLLLELAGIGGVEFYAEIEERVDEGEAQLAGNGFLEV